MNKVLLAGPLVALGLAAISAPERELDEGRDLATLCSENSFVFVEGPELAKLFESGLNHPFIARLIESDFGRALLAEAPLTPEAALSLAANWSGRPVLPTLSILSSRGVALSISTHESTPVWTLALRGDEPGLLRDTLMSVLERVAEEHGFPPEQWRTAHATSHGVEQWFLGEELCLGLRGGLLLASNDRKALTRVLERGCDPAQRGLAGRDAFALARAARDEGSLAWAWLDVRAFGDARAGAGEKLRELSSNPGVHFLLGPAVAGMGSAGRATLDLRLQDKRLALSATGFGLTGPAMKVLFPEQAAEATAFQCEAGVSARLYRDLAGLFSQRTELFPPDVLPKFSEGISNLAFLFGGENVSDEILPALSPWLDVIVATPIFRSGSAPEVPLPAAALSVQVRDPEVFGPRLLTAFQSLIGFLNIDRAQKARPPMLLDIELASGVKISSARFASPGDGEGVDLRYNLEPACAMVAGRFVIGTHVSLVRSLCAELEGGGAESQAIPGEALELFGPLVERALRDNTEALVMNAVLNDGKSMQEARAEVEGLQLLAGLVRRLEYASERVGSAGLRLSLAVDLASGETE